MDRGWRYSSGGIITGQPSTLVMTPHADPNNPHEIHPLEGVICPHCQVESTLIGWHNGRAWHRSSCRNYCRPALWKRALRGIVGALAADRRFPILIIPVVLLGLVALIANMLTLF